LILSVAQSEHRSAGRVAEGELVCDFFGVFLFPIFMPQHGLFATELAAAAVSVLDIIVTMTMLPETKPKSLEELNGELPAKQLG
jgi:hypothetical protein